MKADPSCSSFFFLSIIYLWPAKKIFEYVIQRHSSLEQLGSGA
ncbi:hypothetical protein C943_01178 [Mariniradius saccharolyticus AK6]|uniref:Uncharacterized protein n=1 Tax=Mariniradius saccharolyticus AK6 TaxID=1239962 RepID=M7Y5B7_9BACT|nr:hypothetical protein C943_01178 [Mariniradius saccharolyticus AK6]